MRYTTIKTVVTSAVLISGKYALIFGLSFFLFLFATILMVGGDGTAPTVTHMSAAIIKFTVETLAVSSRGSIFVVVMFWVFIVFALIFLVMLPLKLATQSESQNEVNRPQGYSALAVLLAFIVIPFFIYDSRKNEMNTIEEEKLAFEYVTHNPQVMKLASGSVRTFPSASTIYSNDRNRGRYEFSIVGPNEFFVIVDVSRRSGKPKFTLACATTLSSGYREVGIDDCAQSPIPLPK